MKRIRPSLYDSLLAISAPPRRPEIIILIPSAPYACRSYRHLYSTTVRNFAFKLTCNIVSYYVRIKFRTFKLQRYLSELPFGDLFDSSLSLSTSCPPLPIIIPGRAVLTVTVISFSVLSIIIFWKAGFCKPGVQIFPYLGIFNKFTWKIFSANQFESHPLIIPNLLPIGFTFVPSVLIWCFFNFVNLTVKHECYMVWSFSYPVKLFPEVLFAVFSEHDLRRHEHSLHRGCFLRLLHFILWLPVRNCRQESFSSLRDASCELNLRYQAPCLHLYRL